MATTQQQFVGLAPMGDDQTTNICINENFDKQKHRPTPYVRYGEFMRGLTRLKGENTKNRMDSMEIEEINIENTKQQSLIEQPLTDHDQDSRYTRWTFLIFAAPMLPYHLYMALFWASFSAFLHNTPFQSFLFIVCGIVPSVISFALIIADSTVCPICCNLDLPVCCCACANGYAMCVPMGIAAVLRFILWCAAFSTRVLPDQLNFLFPADNNDVFWVILSMCSDVGPMILLSVDFWFYYVKRDYNGLFGHKLQPLRCITAESIMIMIWSSVMMVGLYMIGCNPWPWIVHGFVSAGILVFAAFLQFSGSITAQYVNKLLFKYMCWGLGIAQVFVFGYIWASTFQSGSQSHMGVIQLVYYSANAVPIVWCLFSIRFDANQERIN